MSALPKKLFCTIPPSSNARKRKGACKPAQWGLGGKVFTPGETRAVAVETYKLVMHGTPFQKALKQALGRYP